MVYFWLNDEDILVVLVTESTTVPAWLLFSLTNEVFKDFSCKVIFFFFNYDLFLFRLVEKLTFLWGIDQIQTKCRTHLILDQQTSHVSGCYGVHITKTQHRNVVRRFRPVKVPQKTLRFFPKPHQTAERCEEHGRNAGCLKPSMFRDTCHSDKNTQGSDVDRNGWRKQLVTLCFVCASRYCVNVPFDQIRYIYKDKMVALAVSIICLLFAYIGSDLWETIQRVIKDLIQTSQTITIWFIVIL